MPNRALEQFGKYYNAFMLEGAKFVGKYDIPECPCTATTIPENLIAYSDIGRSNQPVDAFVHFYINDREFDTPRGGIWNNPTTALQKLKRYRGVITPDFSTYQDMLAADKIYNTRRMRTFGFWLTKQGFEVINNVRWGTPETYEYCFEGIPQNSILSVGTIGCLKEKRDWNRFSDGLQEMIKRLRPNTILVYGSAPDELFEKYRSEGISIISYRSRIQLYFDKRKTL